MKKAKWAAKRQPVKLALNPDITIPDSFPEEPLCHVSKDGIWGISREDDHGPWRVTHVPTGLRAAFVHGKLRAAKRFAELVSENFPVDDPNVEFGVMPEWGRPAGVLAKMQALIDLAEAQS